MILFQQSRGITPALVVLNDSPMHQLAQKSGIKTFGVRAPLNSWRLMNGVRAAAREFKPALVHLHSSQDFKVLGPWLAFNHSRFKIVLQLHIWISHPKRDLLHVLLYKILDELWCSSQPARNSLIQMLPIAEKKLHIVHYGRPIHQMDGDFFDRNAARRELNLPLQATIVGTVSRIDKGKGSGELFDGTVNLMRSNPDLHLAVIGGPTDERKAITFAAMLREKSESLPPDLKSRVHWLGMVKTSFRFLKAFDIFALPTYRECFSLALIEAQLAGLPCIATNSGGSPELVREGSTGWLCEPESTASFQAVLARALLEKNLWNEFGKRAQDRVRAEFDSKAVLSETIEGYRRLLS